MSFDDGFGQDLARIPGGFVVGVVFALALFGIGEERAVAVVAVVIASKLIAVGLIRALTLWRQGGTLADLQVPGVEADGCA